MCVNYAKGTTSETEFVTFYFANPFGPVQLKEEVGPIIEEMFDLLYKQEVVIGELYTKLAVKEKKLKGIKDAARALITLIK